MFMKKKEVYFAPQVELVGLRFEGMLCQSQPQPPQPGGNTGAPGTWDEGGW